MTEQTQEMEKRAQAWLVVSGVQKYLRNHGFEKLAEDPQAVMAFTAKMRVKSQELLKQAEDYGPLEHLTNLGSQAWEKIKGFSPKEDIGNLLGAVSPEAGQGWKDLPQAVHYGVAAGIPAAAGGALWEGLKPRESWDAGPTLESVLASGATAGLPAALGGAAYGATQEPPSSQERDEDETGQGRPLRSMLQYPAEIEHALRSAKGGVAKRQEAAAEALLPWYQGAQKVWRDFAPFVGMGG